MLSLIFVNVSVYTSGIYSPRVGYVTEFACYVVNEQLQYSNIATQTQ
jgi:hypothetical protein